MSILEKLKAIPNGKTWNPSHLPKTDKEYGKCHQLVNDLYGERHLIGDSLKEKEEMVNTKIPKPGYAMIMHGTTKLGHIGIVEEVKPSGAIKIKESNWNQGPDGKGIVGERTLAPGNKSIIGYYNPNLLTNKYMSLNVKGLKIKKKMKEQYGEEKGEKVFYASENKGTIKGVTKKLTRKK